MLQNLSCYIDGLIDMASSFSKKIYHSGIDSICFKNKNFESEFSKYYKIPLNNLNFIKENQTLKEILSLYLEDNIVNNLIYFLEKDLGKETRISTIEDNNILEKLSCFNKGKVPFYFIEGIYIIYYKEYVLCLVMGNNE